MHWLMGTRNVTFGDRKKTESWRQGVDCQKSKILLETPNEKIKSLLSRSLLLYVVGTLLHHTYCNLFCCYAVRTTRPAAPVVQWYPRIL